MRRPVERPVAALTQGGESLFADALKDMDIVRPLDRILCAVIPLAVAYIVFRTFH